MILFLIFVVTILGQTISVSWIVAGLIALWEFLGRVFPTLSAHPPTPLSWIVQFLYWLNSILNNKVK